VRYDEIDGWMDFHDVYDSQVKRAWENSRFIEVGSFLGRSAAYMGQAIKASGKKIRFDAVDTFRGAPIPDHDTPLIRDAVANHGGSIYDQFLQNMRDCGVDDVVRAVPLESIEAAGCYMEGAADFIYIDGDHNYEAVKGDIEAWWPVLKPGGFIGGHDLNESGPDMASQEFAAKARLPRRELGSSWLIRKPLARDARANVYLGVPTYDGMMMAETAKRAFVECTGNRHNVSVETSQSSLLASGFNQLWVNALVGGYTHFAMCHADIVPQAYWIDLLMEELVESGADVIGAVSPIKDARGLTSLGIANPGESQWWTPKRRFTMQEIMQFPSTFTAADTGYPDHGLLLNTGCWLANMENPLWRSEDNEGTLRVHFTIRDRIWRNKTTITCGVQSEDWLFSQRLHECGLKAVATRACKLNHFGAFSYPNNIGWGTWKDDQATYPNWKNIPAKE